MGLFFFRVGDQKGIGVLLAKRNLQKNVSSWYRFVQKRLKIHHMYSQIVYEISPDIAITYSTVCVQLRLNYEIEASATLNPYFYSRDITCIFI